MTLSDDNIKYKSLIEHMNEAVWIWDSNECTVYANPRFCELMEMSLSEMLWVQSYHFWDKESAIIVRDNNLKKRKHWESSSYQGSLLSKTGKKVPVLVSWTLLPDGGTISIMTDLTDLKNNEQKTLTLARAIEHSHDAVILFDENGIILSWNSWAEKIFGYSKEEIISQNIDILFIDPSHLLYTSRSFLQTEIQTLHKNQTLLHIDVTVTRFQQNTWVPASYIFIARNIGQQIQLQKEILIRYEKMQEAYNEFWIIRRRMDYLFDLMSEIKKEWVSLLDISDFIVSSLIMLTRANGAIVRVVNGNYLEAISSFGLWAGWAGKKRVSYKTSLAYKAFLRWENVKILDVSLSPDYSSKTLAMKNNFSSLFSMPLSFRGVFIGSVSLYIHSQKDFHIFENTFLPRYKEVIEIALGTIRMSSWWIGFGDISSSDF